MENQYNLSKSEIKSKSDDAYEKNFCHESFYFVKMHKYNREMFMFCSCQIGEFYFIHDSDVINDHPDVVLNVLLKELVKARPDRV